MLTSRSSPRGRVLERLVGLGRHANGRVVPCRDAHACLCVRPFASVRSRAEFGEGDPEGPEVSQPTNQSINQPTNQPANQSIFAPTHRTTQCSNRSDTLNMYACMYV